MTRGKVCNLMTFNDFPMGLLVCAWKCMRFAFVFFINFPDFIQNKEQKICTHFMVAHESFEVYKWKW